MPIAVKTATCGPKGTIKATSLSMLCQKSGIVRCTSGEHTPFNGQWLLLAPHNGGTVEVRLHRGTFLGSKTLSCGPSLCSPSASRANISCTLRSKLPLVVPKAPLKRVHCRCYAQNAESCFTMEDTHFSVVRGPFWDPNTEVRSRSDWEVASFWDPKSNPTRAPI